MKISLPDDLISFVESQVAEGVYCNNSEYIGEVIRKEHDRLRLRRMLLDGMESKLNETPLDENYFDRLREKARSFKK